MALKIGILGCAGVTRKYAITTFKAIGINEIVVASRKPEVAKRCAAEFSVSHADRMGQ